MQINLSLPEGIDVIQDLVDKSKATAELWVPKWAEFVMDDLAVNSTFAQTFPICNSGPTSLVLRMTPRNLNLIDLEIIVPQGERLGLIKIRREGY